MLCAVVWLTNKINYVIIRPYQKAYTVCKAKTYRLLKKGIQS